MFAQRTFAEETARITRGAAAWQNPSEIRLQKVQSDGVLVVHEPDRLQCLAPPWPEARPHGEVILELKLAGNHVDRTEVERALLRRQARQVQRLEEQDASWLGEEPLWLVAPHVPEWVRATRRPEWFAPGCYWVEPRWHGFLWIAANELPLTNELIPFLMARSGRALYDFVLWVASQRSFEWVLSMLKSLPMSMPSREELLSRFGNSGDPEAEARQQHILDVLLEMNPHTRQRLIETGRLIEVRTVLRRVLARRQLTTSPADDARIEACTDLATLERWHDQAGTAVSVPDALK